MLQAFKHSVYLSASWNEAHNDLNMYVANILVKDFGLLVVGDHKDYKETPHERGLDYQGRVDEILETCSGMIMIFPSKSYYQSTAPFMFLELLLATKHNLPVLILCEDGVEYKWIKIANGRLLAFGSLNQQTRNSIGLPQIEEDDFSVQTLKSIDSVEIRDNSFITGPFNISSAFQKNEIGLVSSMCSDLLLRFKNPSRLGIVFHIVEYRKAVQREIVARTVFQETGFVCINASDLSAGAPFSREDIEKKIAESVFVVADLSGLSQACIFETGFSVGAQKTTILFASKKNRHLPYGAERLPTYYYSDLTELDAMVRFCCRPYRRRVFNIEILQNDVSNFQSDLGSRKRKLVILVHGIRTQAQWQIKAKNILQNNSYITVIPIKYGFIDVICFCLPFFTRNRAIEKLHLKIIRTFNMHPDYEISIVAHSFGTYAITQILNSLDNVSARRLLLCGSIVSQHFDWASITMKTEVINDCSEQDIWPVMASVITRQYGPSGTFGFGTSGVLDRHHLVGHSGYFSEDFIERFWKPWLQSGRIYQGLNLEKNSTPYWIHIISLRFFRYTLLSVVFLLILFLMIFCW